MRRATLSGYTSRKNRRVLFLGCFPHRPWLPQRPTYANLSVVFPVFDNQTSPPLTKTDPHYSGPWFLWVHYGETPTEIFTSKCFNICHCLTIVSVCGISRPRLGRTYHYFTLFRLVTSNPPMFSVITSNYRQIRRSN